MSFHMWKHMELQHFHRWNFHFTYEMGTCSHIKYPIHMWNKLVQNFSCEMLVFEAWISLIKRNIHLTKLISHMKFSFHTWNWNNSHVKYYFHMWNCKWNFYRGNSPSAGKWVKIKIEWFVCLFIKPCFSVFRILGVSKQTVGCQRVGCSRFGLAIVPSYRRIASHCSVARWHNGQSKPGQPIKVSQLSPTHSGVRFFGELLV